MGIPVCSAEFVASSLSDSDSSPLVKLNQEFDSLLELSKYDPQLSFLFLRIVFAGKLTHFLRGLLPSQSEILAQLFLVRQREALEAIIQSSSISDQSYTLAMLGLSQGGSGLANPMDSICPAFIASLISSLDELQAAYPDIKEALADENFHYPQ
jgi:hypothetical protein